jgi:hypothetical protein
MRTLSVLIIVTFFLLSCQKEAGIPDTNNGQLIRLPSGSLFKATGITDQLVKQILIRSLQTPGITIGGLCVKRSILLWEEHQKAASLI